ncbi:ribosome maturation factor RimP [Ghiorsea bivora]|uniref:ribosome maturation factor RimP n=1 Tax=Ghiorsea bivora TaxID=1485545 RepID=UPI00068AFA13|nr:ribosome maturation factor RimP [Ghiorsea bivora]
MADIETIIKELAEPIVDELEIDFMGVVLGGGKDMRLVRVVVDKKGGVGVEALRRLSKGLSLQLDAEDLIPGKYNLEISSPGFDWPLTTEKDYERYEGDWLKITFEDGRPVLEGENLGLNEDGDLRVGGKRGEHIIKLSETSKVIRTVNWGKVSGAGKQKVKRGKSNAKKKK